MSSKKVNVEINKQMLKLPLGSSLQELKNILKQNGAPREYKLFVLNKKKELKDLNETFFGKMLSAKTMEFDIKIESIPLPVFIERIISERGNALTETCKDYIQNNLLLLKDIIQLPGVNPYIKKVSVISNLQDESNSIFEKKEIPPNIVNSSKPIGKEEPKPIVKEEPKQVAKEEPKPIVKEETKKKIFPKLKGTKPYPGNAVNVYDLVNKQNKYPNDKSKATYFFDERDVEYMREYLKKLGFDPTSLKDEDIRTKLNEERKGQGSNDRILFEQALEYFKEVLTKAV